MATLVAQSLALRDSWLFGLRPRVAIVYVEDDPVRARPIDRTLLKAQEKAIEWELALRSAASPAGDLSYNPVPPVRSYYVRATFVRGGQIPPMKFDYDFDDE